MDLRGATSSTALRAPSPTSEPNASGRSRRPVRGPRRPRRPRVRAWLLVAALLLVAAVSVGVVGAVVAWWPPSPAAATTTPTASPSPSASSSSATPPPSHIKAKAWLIMDEQTGIILAAKNPDERLPMASTTKIMTGLLALEHTKDLKTVVVTPKAAVGIPESSIYLSVGEKLTVDQLMQALLIPSANDAAVDLAIWVAGSEKKFVELMNRRAAQLGLVNTHYANPHGLDAAAHYTSARDLATLARVAMQDPRFRSYVDDFQAKIPWKGHSYPRLLVSHNTFLENYSWIDGVKTGWTDPAGYCVALSGEYGGRRYVVALLGDPTDAARLTDGVNLFHYGPSFYDSRQLSTPGVPVAHVSVPYHDEGADVVTTKALSATVRNGAAITAKVEAATQAGLPLQQGQVLGEMVFYADGVEIGRQKLTAERGFPAASWSARMRYRAHNAWDWVTSIF